MVDPSAGTGSAATAPSNRPDTVSAAILDKLPTDCAAALDRVQVGDPSSPSLALEVEESVLDASQESICVEGDDDSEDERQDLISRLRNLRAEADDVEEDGSDESELEPPTKRGCTSRLSQELIPSPKQPSEEKEVAATQIQSFLSRFKQPELADRAKKRKFKLLQPPKGAQTSSKKQGSRKTDVSGTTLAKRPHEFPEEGRVDYNMILRLGFIFNTNRSKMK